MSTRAHIIRNVFLCALFVACVNGCSSVRVVRQDTRFKGGYLRLYGLCLNDAWYIKWPGVIGAYTTAKFDDPRCARQDKKLRYIAPESPKKPFVYRRTTFTVLRINDYAIVDVQQPDGTFKQTHLYVESYDAFTGTVETPNGIFQLKK